MLPKSDIIEYILYLHPDQYTCQYQTLQDYWDLSKDKLKKGIIKKNDAMLYPFHVTLSSFFTSSLLERELTEEIKKAFSSVNFNEYLISKIGTYTHNLKFYKVKNTIGISLYIPSLKEPLLSLSSKIPVKDPLTHHLTLAHNFYPEDENKIQSLINNVIIPLDKWDDKWCVVLWKVINRKKWDVVDIIV